MQKLRKIKLARVRYVPKALEPGLLYVSEEFGAAVHLCACGCGSKVSTPLGPTEWSLTEGPEGPTIRPSVGNWQRPCRSHYLITDGDIVWCGDWSPAEVLAGRRAEEARRRDYYDALARKREGLFRRLWRWIRSLFGH